jgi:hypothetical protein
MAIVSQKITLELDNEWLDMDAGGDRGSLL